MVLDVIGVVVTVAFPRLYFVPIAPAMRFHHVLVQVVFGIDSGFPLHLGEISSEPTRKVNQFCSSSKRNFNPSEYMSGILSIDFNFLGSRKSCLIPSSILFAL